MGRWLSFCALITFVSWAYRINAAIMLANGAGQVWNITSDSQTSETTDSPPTALNYSKTNGAAFGGSSGTSSYAFAGDGNDETFSVGYSIFRAVQAEYVSSISSPAVVIFRVDAPVSYALSGMAKWDNESVIVPGPSSNIYPSFFLRLYDASTDKIIFDQDLRLPGVAKSQVAFGSPTLYDAIYQGSPGGTLSPGQYELEEFFQMNRVDYSNDDSTTTASGDYELSLTAVPEPYTSGLIAGSLLLTLRRRGRSS